MTRLSSVVSIERRFARSARIDKDLGGTPPLVGYVMQASVAKALSTLAGSQAESGQGAFTWTGPYGGGKSSAALLLGNLIGGSSENRRIAREIAGEELVSLYGKAFPQSSAPWAVIAVTGNRSGLRDAIAAAAGETFGWTDRARTAALASDAALISAIDRSARKAHSGTLLILDELGKLLEFAAMHGGDVHLLQDFAEHASRSGGRLAVVGILHQAFDQYAARASREARREWAKVQGRYQDIPFLAGADETVALLGQAIATTSRPASSDTNARAVAAAVASSRPTDEAALAAALAETWPLNPVTSLLLGPVSRQRFAQNERSVFGFLGSAEPAGFQEHLDRTDFGPGEECYDPNQLWDYLAANFGMTLAGGADGAKFSLAFEAIDRAGAKGGPLHVVLTKSAAAIEFFRNGSGLFVSDEVLALSAPQTSRAEIGKTISDLLEWAILTRQPRLGGYALFAGSDFDLEDAVTRAIRPLEEGDLLSIPQRIGQGAVPAKRHYFRTGALRTFELVVETTTVEEDVAAFAAKLAGRARRGSGFLALLVGDGSLATSEVEARCRLVAKALKAVGAVAAVGAAVDGHALRSAATELIAVERVMKENPLLEGDRIARREVAARHSACADVLQRQMEMTLGSAKWWLTSRGGVAKGPLSVLASELADKAYHSSPVLRSELLQRDRPSSSAMAAQRALCHAMVARAGEPDLGFTGFPAEMGLHLTVLKPFGLYREGEGGRLGFHAPEEEEGSDGATLRPAWDVLDAAGDVALAEVYRTWAKPPYGLKEGVMPVIALANLMSRRERIAVYLDGVFQTDFDDLFVDRFLQDPELVRVRRIDRSVREAAYLAGLARIFAMEPDASALPVAQTLYRRFEALPPYARRSAVMDGRAVAVRDAVLQSNDPETLLFERIPEALEGVLSADVVHAALLEAERAYGLLLDKLRRALARSLGADAGTFAGVAARAGTIKDLTNDYGFEAFAMRASAFDEGDGDGAGGDIEGLASLLLHKPPRNWSDRDADQALLELARYGRRFREAEALAIVRDRASTTEAMALVVGLDPDVPPVLRSFVLTRSERSAASSLADRLIATLSDEGPVGNVQLGALARVLASLAVEAEAA